MNGFDIHCHPSLKLNLFGEHIYDPSASHRPWIDLLPAGLSIDLESMRRGEVKAAAATHYLPEWGLVEHGKRLRWLFKIPFTFIWKIREKFEARSGGSRPFEQILALMDLFEADLRAAREEHGFPVSIARSYGEFEQRIAQGETVFLHAIEGAHALGRNIDAETCLAHVDLLAERGLCQLTLAHFFCNIVAASQGGIPPHVKKLMDLESCTQPFSGLNPAGNLGERVVERLLERGVIVDLVHCTPEARGRIYAINDARGAGMRPLLFSHTGLRELTRPEMDPNDRLALPDASDVRRIMQTNGVLGILFMNYWLDGVEEDDPFRQDNGIPLVVATIEKIADICRDGAGNPCYDYIAIGSDLDGFTEVPDDLPSPAAFSDLAAALRNAGIADTDIAKMFWENYRRVLRLGWGGSGMG